MGADDVRFLSHNYACGREEKFALSPAALYLRIDGRGDCFLSCFYQSVQIPERANISREAVDWLDT
jgi:hypothetical protein